MPAAANFVEMNGKERVKNALDFIRTDRLPVAYEAEWEVTVDLVKYFGLDKVESDAGDISSFHSPIGERGGIGIDHEIALQKLLGVDLSKVACPINKKKTIGNWFGMPIKYRRDDGIMIGAWEMQFIEKDYGGGTYTELAGYPLAGVEDVKVFEDWPMPELDLYDYSLLKEVLPRHSDFFVILNMNGCFDFSRYIRGTEEFLLDMAIDPIKADILLEKVNDFAIMYLDRCIEVGKGLIDGVYCGDDFGTQQGLLFSPEMFRRFIKPRYKKLIERVHSYGLKYFHHSCGSIRDILPDMIEIGFDVINPIQPLAKGMEPGSLAREFGNDIVFYGGIDEQHTLPHGKADDVRKEVEYCIKTLGKGGNYIVAPAHGFQTDTSIENILTMYKTAGSYTG
jgi:uroporphyrinogen decarboxylase